MIKILQRLSVSTAHRSFYRPRHLISQWVFIDHASHDASLHTLDPCEISAARLLDISLRTHAGLHLRFGHVKSLILPTFFIEIFRYAPN